MLMPRSTRLFSSDQSAVLKADAHRKIIPVDIECDIEVGGMQMGLGRIVESWDLWSCQDDVARSGRIARPALQKIAKMNSAEFILI